jgi:hypothetical protein
MVKSHLITQDLFFFEWVVGLDLIMTDNLWFWSSPRTALKCNFAETQEKTNLVVVEVSFAVNRWERFGSLKPLIS